MCQQRELRFAVCAYADLFVYFSAFCGGASSEPSRDHNIRQQCLETARQYRRIAESKTENQMCAVWPIQVRYERRS